MMDIELFIEVGMKRFSTVDFEFSVHKVIKEYLPDCVVMCCRFLIGQAWWRKIQSLGLRSEYSNAESDIGKWLTHFFGLLMRDIELFIEVGMKRFSTVICSFGLRRFLCPSSWWKTCICNVCIQYVICKLFTSGVLRYLAK
jgi:hypothetical protein